MVHNSYFASVYRSWGTIETKVLSLSRYFIDSQQNVRKGSANTIKMFEEKVAQTTFKYYKISAVEQKKKTTPTFLSSVCMCVYVCSF